MLKNKQTKSICSNQQEVFCKYFQYYFPKGNIIYSIKSEKEKVMLKTEHWKNEIEDRHLKEGKEKYTGGLGGRKGKGEITQLHYNPKNNNKNVITLKFQKQKEKMKKKRKWENFTWFHVSRKENSRNSRFLNSIC